MSEQQASEHHVVISADTHCGAGLWDYKGYLEQKHHEAFDEWARSIEEGQRRTAEAFKDAERSPLNVGVDGDPVVDGNRNYDSARRLAEQEADGVVAAVLFPNTQPPFAPAAASQFEAPAYTQDMEARWAGLKAHNRWLLDFVAEAPERRAGIAQIFLGDVEGSVTEIEWAAEHGLRGGILVPGTPPDSPFEPLYSKAYRPIWAAAEACDMPLNHHSGGATPDFGSHFPASLAMFMLEVTWWSQRALWHLMFSGVFERHPNLQWVNTESGTAWVPETLAKLDSFYDRMKHSKYGSEAIFGGAAVAGMSLTPSEYWQRQCHVGASFLRPAEVNVVRSLGADKVMWGSDYPHIEGSHPYTDQHLRLTFGEMSTGEATQILTTNAANIYKFDVAALQALADEHCPTKAHVASGITYDEIPEMAKGCPGMAPHSQTQAAA
ncbi:MAG: amidohydrolase family protein [Acidimicrobiales bacterium]|nr:amidohydrolase family protein [Acidimicrobiales bacterium]